MNAVSRRPYDMQLFYAPDMTTPEYVLPEEESRHAVRVLRLGVGGPVWLTDGRGNLYEARIADADVRRCRVKVVRTLPQYGKRNYGVTVAVTPTKNMERYEWFLEKATEVGIDRIIPVESQRSERRVFRPERALRIVTGAMKQSVKAYLPELDALTPFRNVVTRSFDGVKLIAHCNEGGERKPMASYVAPGDNALVLIGPEGDFSPEEVALARENGFFEISLGSARLRTETAALAIVMFAAFINQAFPGTRN